MGIPLLTPGEKISERCVRSLQYYLEEGWEIHGLTEEREIEIVWEEYFI
jgi:arginine/lysine/ornithine decarboxylase